MSYTPEDYNHQNVLKIPLLLAAVFVFLGKYFILFLLPRLPRFPAAQDMGFLNDLSFTRPDLGLLISAIPAIAVLVTGLLRRVPGAHKVWRWIWKNGKNLLLLACFTELVLLLVYGLTGRREFDGVLLLFVYLDVMVLVYLLKSKRVADVFADFPDEQPADKSRKQADVPVDVLEYRKKVMSTNKTKIALVHVGDQRLLELKRDIVLGVYWTLKALGHDTVMSHNMLDNQRLNIILGLDAVGKAVRNQLRQSNLDYVVYEPEIIYGGALNFRPQTMLDLEGDYLPMLARAKQVLSPFKQVVDTLTEKGISSRYVRWGYIPELDEIEQLPDDQKGIDCYFYGLLTPSRKQTLASISEAGLTVKTTDHPGVPAFLRNHFLSRSKLTLSLKHSENWQTVNPYRIMQAAQNGVCVVTEKQDYDLDGYNGYGVEIEAGNFANGCLELIRTDQYKQERKRLQQRVLSEPMVRYFDGVI